MCTQSEHRNHAEQAEKSPAGHSAEDYQGAQNVAEEMRLDVLGFTYQYIVQKRERLRETAAG